MTREEIYEVAERPINFAMGKYMREGYETYKKYAGGFIGSTLLGLLLHFIISLIPLVGVFISSFFLLLMHAGGLKTIRKIRNNESYQFNDFFSGFQNAFPVIGIVFIEIVIVLLVLVPFFFLLHYITETNPSEIITSSIPFVSLLLFFGIIGAMVLYLFSLPLILFANQNYWTALEGSRRVVMKNFFPILGFCISLYILSVVMIIFTCGIGAVFAIPWFHATILAAFEDIYRPGEDGFEKKINSFGNQASDFNTEAEENRGLL